MSKPRHADKDSAPTSSGPKQIHHLSNYIFLFLLAVFLIAVYTFLLQKSYSTSTLEANVDQNITPQTCFQHFYQGRLYGHQHG